VGRTVQHERWKPEWPPAVGEGRPPLGDESVWYARASSGGHTPPCARAGLLVAPQEGKDLVDGGAGGLGEAHIFKMCRGMVKCTHACIRVCICGGLGEGRKPMCVGGAFCGCKVLTLGLPWLGVGLRGHKRDNRGCRQPSKYKSIGTETDRAGGRILTAPS